MAIGLHLMGIKKICQLTRVPVCNQGSSFSSSNSAKNDASLFINQQH